MSAVMDEFETFAQVMQALREWPLQRVAVTKWAFRGGCYYTLDAPIAWEPDACAGKVIFCGDRAEALKWAAFQAGQEAAEAGKDFTTNPMTR